LPKGEYKPKPDDPKIWFASMKTLAQVLSDENQALLEIIDKTQPNSSL
jgi:predicted transcriptional regulator